MGLTRRLPKPVLGVWWMLDERSDGHTVRRPEALGWAWEQMLHRRRSSGRVFLALEEQEKVENKTPLVNESLKKFLNTKDGRLVASLVAEFLQFFHLDFTLAVFQPEASTFQGLEGRENLARDLGIIEAEGTVGGPLLLEVIRRCQQKERGPARGEGALDLADAHSPPPSPEGKLSPHTGPSKIPRYKGQGKKKTSGQKSGAKKAGSGASESGFTSGQETKTAALLSNKSLDVRDTAGPGPHEEDLDGDSFFDDPIPKPEKTYGWRVQRNGCVFLFTGKRGNAVLKDLKVVNDKVASLGLGNLTASSGLGEDDDYSDDFTSTSHRSERSELSIGEKIEGRTLSAELDEANTSDKLDDLTQDLTLSQLSNVADYLEDVAFT
ncbi:LOW QUALITY PROTEIN: FGFR1 oncogene partner [Myotis lucifugus]|uniref:LOW QUALITY PROTEIN: FGFR1 oncogene partner n=1 Tax=Myotis lucifugus TaxID=59463 RepID=UPI000CCBFC1C|nr:LOW QUALITY PROTEIN: FGFR1 oncogene partner [Myotis lucifugus]